MKIICLHRVSVAKTSSAGQARLPDVMCGRGHDSLAPRAFQHVVLSVGCSITLMPLRKASELSCYKHDGWSSFSMHEAQPSGGKVAGNAKLGIAPGNAR